MFILFMQSNLESEPKAEFFNFFSPRIPIVNLVTMVLADRSNNTCVFPVNFTTPSFWGFAIGR